MDNSDMLVVRGVTPYFVLLECQKWMTTHKGKLDGGILRNVDGMLNFCPVYLRWPFDSELEDSLSELELRIYRQCKNINFSAYLYPPRCISDPKHLSAFVEKETHGND